MSKPRALVVDFGGVLTTSVTESLQQFAEDLDIELAALATAALGAYAGQEDNLVTDFETGRISQEDFAVRFAARLSDVCGREVPSAGLIEAMLGRLRLEDEMVEAVRRVHAAGIKTGLLSNSWGTTGYPRDLLDEIFDVVVISGEVGLRKPDPSIFELTANRLGVPLQESVFVDDHAGHLKPAQELGFRTVLHRTPTETIAELEDLFGLSLQAGASDI